MLVDPLSDFLGYQLRRVSLATMAPLVDAYADLGLNPTQAVILRLVGTNPGCNQSEIGRTLGVQRTNMVPIITGLVKAGLIRRDKADGRTHALRLTEAGKILHARLMEISVEHEQRLFGDISSARKRDLIQFCHTLRDKLEKMDELRRDVPARAFRRP